MPDPTEANETQDPGDDRVKWTQFYNEMRDQRDQLRKELLKLREDYFTLYFGLRMNGECDSPYTMDEVLTFVDHQPSVTELIAEFSRQQDS